MARPAKRPGAGAFVALVLGVAAMARLLVPTETEEESPLYERVEEGGRILVTRGFRDHGGRERRASFGLAAAEYRAAIEEFGYEQEGLRAQVERGLLAALEAFRARTGKHFEVEVAANGEGGLSWTYRHWDQDPDTLAFAAGLEDLVLALHAEYFAGRGFLMSLDRSDDSYSLEPDYAALARRDRPRLEELVAAFRALAKELGGDRERLLSALAAYCQEIPYRIPPDVQDGLGIDGVIVPTQVAVDDWGDCDSKSVLFAALWTALSGERTLLVLVPGHMFAAVPGRPRGSTQAGLGYEGRPYLCLEPVGPAKMRPGRIAADSAAHLAAGNYSVIVVE